MLLPFVIINNIFKYLEIINCHSSKNNYHLISKKIIVKNSCKYINKYGYKFCIKHKYLQLSKYPIYTLHPKITVKIFIDIISNNLINKTYHLYNAQSIKTHIEYFNKYLIFRKNFSHICCNHSGISMITNKT